MAAEMNKPIEVQTGRGIVMVEGCILRKVCLKIHTTMTLIIKEKKNLPNAVVKVVQLLSDLLIEGELRT